MSGTEDDPMLLAAVTLPPDDEAGEEGSGAAAGHFLSPEKAPLLQASPDAGHPCRRPACPATHLACLYEHAHVMAGISGGATSVRGLFKDQIPMSSLAEALQGLMEG